ncbi:hypothetical protein FB451DRAFT_1359150 [Mycena latifolia]|nr:hypothetical protein FB451DRAFT_1359150 [Mycena latifolia]
MPPQAAFLTSALQSTSCRILSLPDDVMSRIFVHCLPDTPSEPNASMAPMLFGAVCHEWRDVSRGAPALWSVVRADFTDGKKAGFEQLVREWLGRSGSSPLTLILTFDWLYHCCTSRSHFPGAVPQKFRPSVVDAMIARSSQWQNIELSLMAPCAAVRFEQSFHTISHRLPKLENFRLRMSNEFPTRLNKDVFHTPALRVLDLAAVSPSSFLSWNNLTTFSAENFPPNDIVDVLRRAPRLVCCLLRSNEIEFRKALDGRSGIYSYSQHPVPTAPLPPHSALRGLAIDPNHSGICSGYASMCFKILLLLTLPALLDLTLTYAPENIAETTTFLSFIKRSPLIDTFVVAVSSFASAAGAMTSCLAAMPALKVLALELHRETDFLEIVGHLKSSPAFLPRLQTLFLVLRNHYNSDSRKASLDDRLRALLDALAVRAQAEPRLERCGFVVDDGWGSTTFAADLMARASNLKDAGMKIHLERKDCGLGPLGKSRVMFFCVS